MSANGKDTYQIIVYDETGHVIRRETVHDVTDDELQHWVDTHRQDNWASIDCAEVRTKSSKP